MVLVLVVVVVVDYFFFGDDFFVTVFGAAFALFGLGAFGFFVGPLLVAFLAFDGDDDFAFDLAAFFSEATAAVVEEGAFLAFAADDFFSPTSAAAVAAAVAFFALPPLFAVPFGDFDAFVDDVDDDFLPVFALASAPPAAFAPVDEPEASLNDPEAPLPLV